MSAPVRVRARNRQANDLLREDGTPTRLGIIITEYVWLHETCHVPEGQVAKQLGITELSLRDALRRGHHPRPAATLAAIDATNIGLRRDRALLNRRF